MPLMYRASTNPPKTAWARHLDQVMRDKGWSRVRLFEEVGAELGYGSKSRSAILPLLEDKEPTSAQATVLRRHFGEPDAIEVAPVPPSDYAAVVAAIDRQTAMLKAVLDALVPRPPDPLVSQAQEDWSGAERRLAAEKAGTNSLPRKPSRARRAEAQGLGTREAEPA